MALNDEKPDGFVAWHPFHRGFIRDGVCEIFTNIQGAENKVKREQLNKYLHQARWRIRPCKIVFLDEPIVEEGKGDV